MPTLEVGKLRFTFPDGWTVSQYDDWAFYRRQFQSVCGGTKAIDILAVENTTCCWVLEVKDYRENPRTKAIDIADEVAEKVRDTLAGLFAAQLNANDDNEKNLARSAIRAKRLRVVFHLEQPYQHSKLFPRVIRLADVMQKLKRLIKAIDPHPQLVQIDSSKHLPWFVTSIGGSKS